MTRFSLLLATLIGILGGLNAQVIVITFEGTVNATPTPLDSIRVMNLPQGGDTTIYFPDNVLVLGSTEVSEAGSAGFAMQSLPNPFSGSTEVVLEAMGGVTQLALFDVAGRELVAQTANLAAGAHRFLVNCERPGVHLLTMVQGGVRSSLRLVATEGAGVTGLSLVGRSVQGAPKSDRSLFTWTPGDELRYIGYATSAGVLHSAAIDEVPVATATRTFIMAAGAVCPDSPSVTDSDGNVYAVVQIGSQCWMASNLRTTTYANGDLVPNVTDAAQWVGLTTGAWVHYNNDSQYENPYGKLYNWYAVADPRNVCPTGWHVPSDAEWTVLSVYLGGESVAGGKMKSTGTQYWGSPNEGATNESGFSGLPGGNRNWNAGGFGGLVLSGNWRSDTEAGFGEAWTYGLSIDDGILFRGDPSKNYGFSVRCLRD